LSAKTQIANHLQAAADAARIGLGHAPPGLVRLLADVRRTNGTTCSRQLQQRIDTVWLAVENEWDRVLAGSQPDLFYEIWSDRFAAASDILVAVSSASGRRRVHLVGRPDGERGSRPPRSGGPAITRPCHRRHR